MFYHLTENEAATVARASAERVSPDDATARDLIELEAAKVATRLRRRLIVVSPDGLTCLFTVHPEKTG